MLNLVRNLINIYKVTNCKILASCLTLHYALTTKQVSSVLTSFFFSISIEEKTAFSLSYFE